MSWGGPAATRNQEGNGWWWFLHGRIGRDLHLLALQLAVAILRMFNMTVAVHWCYMVFAHACTGLHLGWPFSATVV